MLKKYAVITLLYAAALWGCQANQSAESPETDLVQTPGSKDAGHKADQAASPMAMSESLFKKLEEVQPLLAPDAPGGASDQALKMLEVMENDCHTVCNPYEFAIISRYFAYLYFQKGDIEDAKHRYDRVLSAKPHIPLDLEAEALYRGAALSYVLGEYENMAEYLEKYDAIRPPHAPDSTKLHRALAEQEVGSDSNHVAIMKTAPVYPRVAIENSIEGYCTVIYDVQKNGLVANIEAADCPDEIFLPAAIEAASKFRYRPKTVNGEPVVVRGVKNKFSFQLDDLPQDRTK